MENVKIGHYSYIWRWYFTQWWICIRKWLGKLI